MLLVSGMGAALAELAARNLLEKGATALVSWGFAGGLIPGLFPGSLVVPEKILGANQSVYFVDALWHKDLGSGLKGEIDFQGGTLAESAEVVASCAAKKLLLRRTGAVAVDMESASLARVAKESRIPFLAVRAITDSAHTDLPRWALGSVDEFGRVRISRLLLGLFRRPAEIFALARTRRDVQAAETALARAALRAGSRLLCPRCREEEHRKRGPLFPAAARGKIS